MNFREPDSFWRNSSFILWMGCRIALRTLNQEIFETNSVAHYAIKHRLQGIFISSTIHMDELEVCAAEKYIIRQFHLFYIYFYHLKWQALLVRLEKYHASISHSFSELIFQAFDILHRNLHFMHSRTISKTCRLPIYVSSYLMVFFMRITNYHKIRSWHYIWLILFSLFTF